VCSYLKKLLLLRFCEADYTPKASFTLHFNRTEFEFSTRANFHGTFTSQELQHYSRTAVDELRDIWHSYKQERGCLMHFAHLANTLLKDE